MRNRATVVLPCRGMEENLARNIDALLHQNYASYEIILVTTENDEAFPLLQQIAQEYAGSAKCVIAPTASACAQKLANQLAAIRAADPSSDFFVFVDSDGVSGPDFLSAILKPLSDPAVGVCTGWRWYVPESGGYWSYVRSAWNAGAMPFLVDNRHNIAFGGAMAVRCEVFYRARVGEVWSQAVSDGLSLARAVKDLGMKVHYEPACLMVTRDGGDWREVLEWTNRQATISRVYMPEFWCFTAIAHSLTILLAIAVVALGAFTWGWMGALGAASIYLALIETNAALTLLALRPPLSSAGVKLTSGDTFRYLIAAPVAVWLYSVNILRSALSRTIMWRGICYRLEAPNRTVVLVQ